MPRKQTTRVISSEPEDVIGRRLAVLSLLAGLIAFLASGALLASWVFDLPRLRNLFPGLPVVMPNTALALLVLALALLLRQSAADGPARRIVALLSATVVGAFALLVAAEYIFDRNLGIDELLVPAGPPIPAAPPGRPGFNTAVALLLSALSIATLDWETRRGRRPAELFALGVLLIGFIALAGYAYGTASALGTPHLLPYTDMAIQTAGVFVILATGVLCARSTVGLMAIVTSPHLGGIVARRLLLGAMLIPVLGLAAAGAERVGWLDEALASGALAIFSLAVAIALILSTSRTVSRLDADRQRRAEELRQWKHFFDHAEFGAAVGAPDGTLVRVNDAFARMHGGSAKEFVGRPGVDVFAPSRKTEFLEQLKVIHTRGHLRFESEHLRKDGSTFPVEVDATAVADEDGTLLYRAISVLDITERKRAEALRSQLASIVEFSDDAIFSTTLDGTVLTWNPAAERMFGFPAAEIVNRSGDITTPEDRRPERRENLDRLRRGERIGSYETVRRRKDGSIVPVLLTLSPIIDAAGRITAISCIVHDISARKEMEEALRRSEEMFRQLFEQASDGIFITDLEGRYTDVNSSGCKVLDCTRDDIVGKTIADITLPDELPRLREAIDVLRTGGTQISEWHLRRKDGRYVPVEVSAKMLPDGRLQGFVRDITERKQILEALQRARDEEQRLRAQLEEWTSVVAHDLRQPVSTIRVAADLLRRGAAREGMGERVNESLNRIVSASTRLGRMIGDLLDVSRMDSHHLQLKRRETELLAHVRGILGRLAHVLEGHPVRVVVPTEPVWLSIDPDRIEQVLGNLLSNAAKYSDPGNEIAVVVEAGDAIVKVSVTNSGRGIPREDMARLFSRFERSWAGESRIGGIGLGLYISRGLIEAHGGRIWAESTPGKATTFSFELPRETMHRGEQPAAPGLH